MPSVHDPAQSAVLFLVFLLISLIPAAQRVDAQPVVPGASAAVTTIGDTIPAGVGGVTVDRLGYVYVADFMENVWKISPQGEWELFVSDMYGSSGNAIDSRGNLLQSNFTGNFVVRVARSGEIETVATGLGGPVGIAVDPSDNLFVVECRTNTIARITPDGTLSRFAESELLNCPNGITRAPDGTFYVVNFSDGLMLAVDSTGAVSEFATVPGGGNGHVVYGAGALYSTGFRSNQVYRISMDGEVEVLAGTGAFSATDGAGGMASSEADTTVYATFASPNGIGYDAARDILYTNDYITPLQNRQWTPKSVVRRIKLPNIIQEFNYAYQSAPNPDAGIAAARDAYHQFREARPGFFTYPWINALGYQYLQSGKVQEAIEVFRLNTEDYPTIANTWDSLAEGYMTAGPNDLAIENYQKVLELDPGNANAVTKLAELGPT